MPDATIPLALGDFVVIESATYIGRHTVGEVVAPAPTAAYVTLRRVREKPLPEAEREFDQPGRRKRDAILFVIGRDAADAVKVMGLINDAHDTRQAAIKAAEKDYTAAIRLLRHFSTLNKNA